MVRPSTPADGRDRRAADRDDDAERRDDRSADRDSSAGQRDVDAEGRAHAGRTRADDLAGRLRRISREVRHGPDGAEEGRAALPALVDDLHDAVAELRREHLDTARDRRAAVRDRVRAAEDRRDSGRDRRDAQADRDQAAIERDQVDVRDLPSPPVPADPLPPGSPAAVDARAGRAVAVSRQLIAESRRYLDGPGGRPPAHSGSGPPPEPDR